MLFTNFFSLQKYLHSLNSQCAHKVKHADNETKQSMNICAEKEARLANRPSHQTLKQKRLLEKHRRTTHSAKAVNIAKERKFYSVFMQIRAHYCDPNDALPSPPVCLIKLYGR